MIENPDHAVEAQHHESSNHQLRILNMRYEHLMCVHVIHVMLTLPPRATRAKSLSPCASEEALSGNPLSK